MRGTPRVTSAGAAIVARTMYLAVVGSPIPRISDAIMVKKRVSTTLPAPTDKINDENLSPSPVSVTTPTIIPAQAQAEATPTALRAPFSKALRISFTPMGLSLLISAPTMATTTAILML